MFGEVFRPVQPDLQAAQAIYRDRLSDIQGELSIVGAEAATHRGKWLRPGLFLLAVAALDRPTERHHKVAAAVELLHTASLVHDDIRDGASVRRHRPTINARFGTKQAVLFGDLLVSLAFQLVSLSHYPEAYAALSTIMEALTTGEALQDKLSRSPDEITEENALEAARRKTAVFPAEICALAARVAGMSKAREDELHRFGLEFGMAFQILDDVLDVVGREEAAGKTLRTDLIECRPGLPLALALNRSRKAAMELLPPRNEDDLNALTELMLSTGALQRALGHAGARLNAARRHLDRAALGESDAARSLYELIDLMVRHSDKLRPHTESEHMAEETI